MKNCHPLTLAVGTAVLCLSLLGCQSKNPLREVSDSRGAKRLMQASMEAGYEDWGVEAPAAFLRCMRAVKPNKKLIAQCNKLYVRMLTLMRASPLFRDMHQDQLTDVHEFARFEVDLQDLAEAEIAVLKQREAARKFLGYR